MNILDLLAVALPIFMIAAALAITIIVDRKEIRRLRSDVNRLHGLVANVRTERDEARRATARSQAGMRRLISDTVVDAT